MCYLAERGRSALKDVGINSPRRTQKIEELSSFAPLDGRRGWPLETGSLV